MSLAKVIGSSLRLQQQMLRAYPAASLLLLGILVQLGYAAWKEHAVAHLIAYLAAVWTGCLLTDIVISLSSLREAHFAIRHSPLWESVLILASTLLGIFSLGLRFSRHWASLHGIARVTAISFLFAFAFPIALALIFSFYLRYKPGDLGVNVRFWYLPIIIHIVFGAITLSLVPQVSHWKSFYREDGLLNGLYTGLVTAGLSEEFVRMLLQTRLGRLFSNQGLGFMLASMVWAWMHIPVLHSETPTAPVLLLVVNSLHIVPIGILWGYMTHRTKSLLPATFAHGLNLWGLQNQL